MRLVGDCSEPDNNNGIVKILITVYSDKQPQYLWINVLKESVDFDPDLSVEVIIRNVQATQPDR